MACFYTGALHALPRISIGVAGCPPKHDLAEAVIQACMAAMNVGYSSEVLYLKALKTKGRQMFPPKSECQQIE